MQQRGRIPLLLRRGGCGINPSREATEAPQTGWSLTRSVTRGRPPRPRLFGPGTFLGGAATPPHEEGNAHKLNAALLAGSTLWCLSIVAAPAFGLSWVYDFFSMVCHQDPTRSWHIFGESLPVCIRCASIYFAFTAALWLGIRTNIRWLRVSLLLMLCEFILARVLIDAAILRSLSGILVGLSAAPFVKQGVEEIRDLL